MFKFVLFFAITINAASASEIIQDVFSRYGFFEEDVNALLSKNPELNNSKIAYVKDDVNENSEHLLKIYLEENNDAYLIKEKEDSLEIEKMDAHYSIVGKVVEGKIEGTILETLIGNGFDERVSNFVSEGFKEEFISTKKLRGEASYILEIENYFDEDGTFIKYGNVLHAKLIVNKAVIEKTLKTNFKDNTIELVPVIPDINERVFTSPVGENVVSSIFNLARRHPVIRRIQPHNGVDFRAKSGTPVYPAFEGKIIQIARAKAKGKFILIEHPNGLVTTYDHLKNFKNGLKVGMTVSIDDQIGNVGRTGYATGAHLHFGVIKNGYYVNPIYYFNNYKVEEDSEDSFSLEELINE